jgi:hypothetical protein
MLKLKKQERTFQKKPQICEIIALNNIEQYKKMLILIVSVARVTHGMLSRGLFICTGMLGGMT